ncbi:hypothetical protein EVAR_89622_1 [Eumeta japonica]|uniref:Uncharacterized protein n=1 Tax=Eumeta variegata TaxID=151549 RepID=A0A4C1ZCD5_EUMVA|nr:hypothetical protein EVAR_89622_1 [Eumeta japonica]
MRTGLNTRSIFTSRPRCRSEFSPGPRTPAGNFSFVSRDGAVMKSYGATLGRGRRPPDAPLRPPPLPLRSGAIPFGRLAIVLILPNTEHVSEFGASFDGGEG